MTHLICIGEDNFNDVYQKVANISSRYYEFGIALGLPLTELNNIKEESKTPRALSSVLQAWLKLNYNAGIHGPPTWRKLVEAVDSPAGGNNHALAKAIASEHPIGITPSLLEAACMIIRSCHNIVYMCWQIKVWLISHSKKQMTLVY